MIIGTDLHTRTAKLDKRNLSSEWNKNLLELKSNSRNGAAVAGTPHHTLSKLNQVGSKTTLDPSYKNTAFIASVKAVAKDVLYAQCYAIASYIGKTFFPSATNFVKTFASQLYTKGFGGGDAWAVNYFNTHNSYAQRNNAFLYSYSWFLKNDPASGFLSHLQNLGYTLDDLSRAVLNSTPNNYSQQYNPLLINKNVYWKELLNLFPYISTEEVGGIENLDSILVNVNYISQFVSDPTNYFWPGQTNGPRR